jgi:electron transport complex protein RnfB
MIALAELLGRDPMPLEDEEAAAKPKAVAIIIEKDCIGCTLCIQACPVDAILGAAKQMHTVIEAECTGCELCIPPCPVECIDMVPIKDTTDTWRWPLPNQHSAGANHV